MLEIPFYITQGRRCAQAAMRSVLGARIPGRDFSYEELDKLTLHNEEEATSTPQIAFGFLQLGVKFEYFMKPNGINCVLGENFVDYLREFYGENAKYLLRKINVDSLRQSVIKLVESKSIFELSEKPKISKLEEMLDNNKIPLCLVDYNVLIGSENLKIEGHYIVITGSNKDHIFYHDSGPKEPTANKLALKERFLEAWNLCLFDHDLIVVG
jgi:hypothetical protein